MTRGKEAEIKIDEVASRELCPYFDNIPSHITAHILLQLPIKSLLICRCVCKIWKTLISESHFAKSYSDQAPTSLMIRPSDNSLVSRTLYLLECGSEMFELGSNNPVKLDPIFKLPLREEIEGTKNKSKHSRHAAELVLKESKYGHGRYQVVNSCNGLLCLCDPSKANNLVICNPITGEFIKLPEVTRTPISLHTDRVRMLGILGFGFKPTTNEYKVIKLWITFIRTCDIWVFQPMTAAEIHTLGTPSWRNVEVDRHIRISGLTHATYVNGALYWIRRNFSELSILCFDFESERLQPFPSPLGVFENENNRIIGQISIGELNGFLYICDASSIHDVTVWIMKKYGIGESWTKVYSIDTSKFRDIHNLSPRFRLCWPVKHFEEGAAIWLYLYRSSCFIYYELQKRRYKIFRTHGITLDDFEVLHHVPSLISLKDVVKGDNIEVLNIHSKCANFKLREEDEVLSLVQEFVCYFHTAS